ncbi:major facilitator superfamily domain-containing protein, partial [Halenospora varia]
ALLHPIRVFAAPIFILISFAGRILVGYVFIIATSITGVFQAAYNFSEGKAGLTFLGIAQGMGLGSIFCSVVLDWYTKKMKALHEGVIKPEWRLWPMVLGFVLAPLRLFLYGVGAVLLGFSAYSVNIPATTYVVDIFGIYRASAMAALTIVRNLFFTLWPLAGPPLYRKLGYGWGNSVLAFMALAFAPLPFLLLKYGERIRGWRRGVEKWS